MSSRLSHLPYALPSVFLVRGLPLHLRLQVCFKGGLAKKVGFIPQTLRRAKGTGRYPGTISASADLVGTGRGDTL